MYLKGKCVLMSNGNHTHVGIQAWNSFFFYYYYYKVYTIVIANKLNYHVHYKIKVVKNYLKFAIFTRVLRTIKKPYYFTKTIKNILYSNLLLLCHLKFTRKIFHYIY